MKRLVSLILLLAMALNICGCAPSASAYTTLQAGYARIDITPTESVPLAGYGSTSDRMANNVLQPLYATCIALTDRNSNTILLFAMDLQRSSAIYSDPARALISQRTGVPESQIYINASHTHAGPDMDNTSEPSIIRYNAQLIEKMADVAQTAMDDRKTATMSTGSIETQGLNFVRHYTFDDVQS